MQTTTVSRTPFFGLLGNLRDEIKMLIREEVKLVKAELGEKGSRFGKNAVFLVIGAFVAYTGLILLLAGLGVLLGHAFEHAGLSRMMALFLGLGVIGLVIAGLGGAFIMKALAAFEEEPLAPQKTIDTIKHMRQPDFAKERAKERQRIREELKPKRSPDEIKSSIDSTQDLMKAHAHELRHRLTPGYIGKAFAAGVRHHPVRSGLIGTASGLAGFLVVKYRSNHKLHHNHH